MEAQRDKARAKSAFDRKGEEFTFTAPANQDGLRNIGDRFDGYTTTDVPARGSLRSSMTRSVRSTI